MKDITISIVTPNNKRNLIVTKVSKVNLGKNGEEFIYFDKMKDNTWRMVYTENKEN